MPNLVNISGDNVFYNYRTPLVRGEALSGATSGLLNTFLSQAYGSSGVNWFNSGTGYAVRFPAPGLEMKTSNVTTATSAFARCVFTTNNQLAQINTTNTDSGNVNIGSLLTPGVATFSSDLIFAVANTHSLIYCSFADSTFASISKFFYLGWLREPQYTGTSVGARGLVAIVRTNNGLTINVSQRPTTENGSGATTLSTANDSITNPIITCSISTPGADVSDIVIRDAAAPNYAIGKLYNCVSLPSSAVVGEIWKNTGVDPETGGTPAPNTDKYLVVMPWGGRKLGMRVWTEGFS